MEEVFCFRMLVSKKKKPFFFLFIRFNFKFFKLLSFLAFKLLSFKFLFFIFYFLFLIL